MWPLCWGVWWKFSLSARPLLVPTTPAGRQRWRCSLSVRSPLTPWGAGALLSDGGSQPGFLWCHAAGVSEHFVTPSHGWKSRLPTWSLLERVGPLFCSVVFGWCWVITVYHLSFLLSFLFSHPLTRESWPVGAFFGLCPLTAPDCWLLQL